MKTFHLSVVVLVVLASALGLNSHAGVAEDEAVKAAEKWLALVDDGEYAKSWGEAAEFFKNAVAEENWCQALDGVRKPLGELVSRKLESAQYATTLPGAPDGEYVVIRFTTGFANKQSAIETITPMKQADGSWRVSGYFIK